MDRIANVRTEVTQPRTAELTQDSYEGFSTFGPDAEHSIQLQAAADESPNVKQLKSFQEAANNSPQVKQFRRLQDAANGSTQVSQLKAQQAAMQPTQLQGKDKLTGLPMQLKAGIESLGKQSLDDVRVHYNSEKPAQLQAHAFAQGPDIHVAPGQEQHLGHEAWHVVQQKQGRVKPTLQMKGVAINDDHGLEREADIMGAKAMEGGSLSPASQLKSSPSLAGMTVQPKWINSPELKAYLWDQVLDGFQWFYNPETAKMYYKIKGDTGLAAEEEARLRAHEEEEFTAEEWETAGWRLLDPETHSNEVVPSWKVKMERMLVKARKLFEMGVIAGPEQKGIAKKYWGEALDENHRPVEGKGQPASQETLWEVYRADPEANVAMNFYDWMETQGPGDVVRYASDEKERAEFAATIGADKKLSIAGRVMPMAEYAFVLANGNLYSARKQTAGAIRIHHSTFMAGAAVSCAGVFFVNAQGIFYIRDYSGHYQPGVEELKRLKAYLVARGLGDLTLRKENGTKYNGKIGDWNEQ